MDPDYGLQESTLATRAAGTRLFNAWRIIKGMPVFDDTEAADFASDNLEHIMFEFACWMGSTNIPQHLKMDSLPALETTLKKMKYITVTSKEKYLMAVMNEIRKKHGRNPVMHDTLPPNGDQPSWFGPLKARFSADATRFQLIQMQDPDNVIGDSTILALQRPCFKDINFDPEESRDEKWFLDTPDALMTAFDLKQAMSSFVRRSMCSLNTKMLQGRALVSTIFNGAMRSGEVKYQQFQNWEFMSSVPCLEVMNEESKTTKKTTMPMVPDADSPLLCFVHSLACFFSVESGLMRTELQLGKGHGNYVYPDLQNMADKSVSTHVTKCLRSTLPANVSASLVNKVTGKSLRKGAITDLAMHPQCDIFISSFRSGHALDSALQYYFDKANVGLSITGARCLAGYADVYQKVYFARVECLGSRNKESVEALMNHVLPSNIPEWKAGGSKYNLKKVFLASLLQHHKFFLKEFGPTCSITTHLHERARELKLHDPLFPECSPEAVIHRWSDIVREDHLRRNQCTYASAEDGISGLKGLVTAVAGNQSELIAEFSSLKRKMDDRGLVIDTRMKSLEEGVSCIKSTQDDELDACKTEIMRMQHKLSTIRTPPHASSSVCAQLFGSHNEKGEPPTAKARLDLAGMVGHVRQFTSDGAMQEALVGAAPKPAMMLVSQSQEQAIAEDALLTAADPNYKLGGGRFGGHSELVHSNRSARIEKAASNKDFTIATLLEDYHRFGFLKERTHPFSKSVIGCPNTVSSNNKTLAFYCMEFMDQILDEGDIAFLKGTYTDFTAASRTQFYNKVQAKAMDELWLWEGKDPDIERAQVGKTAGAKPKPNITGFGTRVKSYKIKYLERTGQTQEKPRCVEVPLVHPRELPEPGHVTPKGHRNVASYFSKRRTN